VPALWTVNEFLTQVEAAEISGHATGRGTFHQQRRTQTMQREDGEGETDSILRRKLSWAYK
jgi:hypothetical protein